MESGKELKKAVTLNGWGVTEDTKKRISEILDDNYRNSDIVDAIDDPCINTFTSLVNNVYKMYIKKYAEDPLLASAANSRFVLQQCIRDVAYSRYVMMHKKETFANIINYINSLVKEYYRTETGWEDRVRSEIAAKLDPIALVIFDWMVL